MAIKSKSFLTATVMVAAMSVSGCNRSKDLIVEQVGGKIQARFDDEEKGKVCINSVSVYKVGADISLRTEKDLVWNIALNATRMGDCRSGIEILTTPKEFDEKVRRKLSRGRYLIQINGGLLSGQGFFELR
ncbi:hypothetical protein [Sphingomonas alpina]|uniref:Lipoprotein n=1 Tax=Sphingomonas alpina TaxID=653931 RepID=A0A7H0LF34_9SPHN|nr:hypothetical protein [Sphingomonas alpina]QNQ08287.1 hypothetical protein H3Z74_16200 [Sphingomonas alpina]